MLWLMLVACLSMLVSCGSGPPTPGPVTPEVAPSLVVFDPATPSPAPAASSTATARPAPSATPSPRPSPTASPTPSSTATPTWTPSPTPTPSPTSPPGELLGLARHAQDNGDYPAAISAYQALLAEEPSSDQARLALYGLAETYLLDQDYAAAAATWQSFLETYPQDPAHAQAAFMAARAYQASGDCEQAVVLYDVSLPSIPPLAALIQENMGDCYAELGAGAPLPRASWEKAIAAYRAALAATADRSVQVSLRERIADLHLAMDDPAAAVAEYDAILAVAKIESYRAKIEYLAGQALAGAGDTAAAQVRYQRAVDRYPKVEYSYLSLVELVDAGVAVDELQRGMVDYYAGASYPDAYGAAIRAFDRHLAQPGPKADQALYYKALAQRALEQPAAALETLDALITGYSQSTYLASAWLETGVTLATTGDNDAAVKAYRDTAAFFPAAEAAPNALWRAARLRDGEPAFVEAATLYEELQKTFPAYAEAAQALWRAALAYYRAGNEPAAVTDLEALLERYPGSDYETKALYWLGKLAPEGQRYWDQLLAANPREYYALRVAQTRAGEPLTATRLITEAVEPPAWDPVAAEAEVLPWLRDWTDVPTGTRLTTLPANLRQRSDLRRGEALLAVALRRSALTAFDQARAALWDQPLGLAQLAFYFRERGIYGLAARCAARLAGLSPVRTVHGSPLSIQRLAYPLPYADLLSAQAQERHLDPLLLAALVRQESLFEKEAESYVGARGLGQVMPATGQGIAGTLGLTDFQLDDLYRPAVSIRFAAFYLDVQMKRFGNQILVALAAYNGGPGNTMRWQEGTAHDLDLFVEVITASQSRIYLQRVYEQYLVYERIYRQTD